MPVVCFRVPSKVLCYIYVVTSLEASLGYGSFFRLLLFLMTSTVLRCLGQVFSRISLIWDLSDDFLMRRLELRVLGRKIMEIMCHFLFFLTFYLFIFRERGREGEREGRNINVWLSLKHPPLGTWSSSQACALTRNWNGDLLVCRRALNPLSHTSQG